MAPSNSQISSSRVSKTLRWLMISMTKNVTSSGVWRHQCWCQKPAWKLIGGLTMMTQSSWKLVWLNFFENCVSSLIRLRISAWLWYLRFWSPEAADLVHRSFPLQMESLPNWLCFYQNFNEEREQKQARHVGRLEVAMSGQHWHLLHLKKNMIHLSERTYFENLQSFLALGPSIYLRNGST